MGVRVEDCVPTHSSSVISNPLSFWLGTGRTVGGCGLWRGGWGLGGLGSRIHIHMDCLYTWVGLGSLYTWTAILLTVIEKKCFPRVIY